MGRTLKTVGMVIGAAALIATGAGALLMPGLAGSVTLFGVSAGTLNMVSAGLTAVGGLLEKPQSIGSGSPTDWTSNPDQPVPFAFGRVGVAGKIVHRDEFGSDNFRQGIISIYSGAGPIRSFQTYKAGDLTVNFSGAGAALGKYAGQMWRVTRLGMQPDTALSVVLPGGAGQQLPQWGSSHKLSGKACDLLVLQQDSKFSVYPTGEPTPLAVLEGIYGYDPRFDDTYPGGAGTCRLGVRSTYRWIDNPIIAALNWALGLVENGQVVGGVGASIDGIDVPAFVEAANIADANDWKVTAWPDTSEDVSQVLKQFLQAGGASYARHAGKISCVSRGAARASIVTITGRDTCGPLELDTGSSSFNRLNTITPEFMSEAHGWKKVPADPVTFAALRTEDGSKKSDSIEYRFVPAVKQAAQLAAYDILDAREPFSGTIPLKPHLRRLKRGDCFVIDEPGFLLDGVKCMVLSRTYQSQTGEVRIAFRSETDGKHDLALGKTTTMPEYPALTPADPTLVTPPAPGDWTITPRPPSGGGQLPGFDLGGSVSNGTATAMLVEHGPTAAGPWTQAYQGPPTVTTVPIDGLQPGATYYIAVSYQRGENFSDRQVYGPIPAPQLISTDVSTSAPTIVGLQTQITTAFGDIFDVSELVADARADIDAQGAEIAAARNGEASLSARIATVNQARIDGDSANATAITNLTARTANTEADIIDIENAAAAETTARVQSVNQLLAMARDGSMNPNPIFSAWSGALPDGWTRHGTVGASTMTKVAGINGSPNALRQASNLTSECGLRTDVSPSAGGEYVVIEADFTLVSGSLVGAGILCQTLNSGGGSAGNTFSQAFATVKDASGTVRGAGVAGQTYRYRLLANLKAATVATYRLYGMTRYSPGAWGPADGAATLDWHRLAIRPATPEEIAAGTAIPALQASVTTNSLAIVDIENELAIASWQVVASAGGGKPARIGLTSSTLGSFVALDAPFIFWGDNTVFDDATDTLQTTVGGRIRVLALGTPFGAASDLLEWWGPSSIALGSMTKANGYNGRMTASPYVFDNALTPAPGTPTVNVTAPCSSNGTTNATAVSSTKTVPASPRVKASFGYSYDGGSIMSGVGSSTFVVEFFEQQGATINVLETTTMTVTGTPTSVSDVAGGSVSNFPTGKNGTLTGSVTYGIRHRRTSGSLNFTNLRCTLYAEIIGQT